jgi:clan AA aspartic protease (TIGR02281 family)
MYLDPDAPLIVVSVTLQGTQGTRELDMALDTGATYVMIPADIALELGYDLDSSVRRIDLATASSIESAPIINVERIRVLDMDARNVDVVCMTLPSESYVQGLLGLSFLRNFDIDIHFKRGALTLR